MCRQSAHPCQACKLICYATGHPASVVLSDKVSGSVFSGHTRIGRRARPKFHSLRDDFPEVHRASVGITAEAQPPQVQDKNSWLHARPPFFLRGLKFHAPAGPALFPRKGACTSENLSSLASQMFCLYQAALGISCTSWVSLRKVLM